MSSKLLKRQLSAVIKREAPAHQKQRKASGKAERKRNRKQQGSKRATKAQAASDEAGKGATEEEANVYERNLAYYTASLNQDSEEAQKAALQLAKVMGKDAPPKRAPDYEEFDWDSE